MYDLITLIKKAGEQESPHWSGIAKIMLANCIGFTTDLFGNVPYSEAFLGPSNFAPVFDTQESIYAAIISMLDDGLADLDKTNAIPLSGDMIYGGSVAKWKKAGNALKARYLMHQVNVNASVKGQIAALVDASFAGNDDDMQFQYGPNPSTEASPLYQFMDQRAGDITMCATLVDFLAASNDPRLPVYAAKDAGDHCLIQQAFTGKLMESLHLSVMLKHNS
jgi:hypothetical protein